ncbi:hypothetical protein, partial [Streptomyces sp. GbtcB7]|uniref:hypothetical protein n=1 Tax=Streptomyces sp. GbtcB7 TaxID=2824752 RepID=UPI001C2FED94
MIVLEMNEASRPPLLILEALRERGGALRERGQAAGRDWMRQSWTRTTTVTRTERQDPTRVLISLRAAAFVSRFAAVAVCQGNGRLDAGALDRFGELGVEPLLAACGRVRWCACATISATGPRAAFPLGIAAPCARQNRARDNLEEVVGAWRERG